MTLPFSAHRQNAVRMGRLRAPRSAIGIQDMMAVFTTLLMTGLYLLSVWITGRVHSTAVRRSILALPDARSAHQVPTPVGGGLAIVAVFALGVLALWLTRWLPGHEALLLATALPVAWMGWCDDRAPMDFRLRLIIQLVAVAAVLVWVQSAPALPPLAFGPLQIPTLLFTWLLLPLALLWLTNLYNFMDGIDGIAGTQVCFVTCAAGLWLLYHGDLALAMSCLSLFAASAGFLVWNWAPARIFMGDVGSAFLGFTLGLVALLSHLHDTMSLWSWILLMGVFIVDATFTLGRRLLNGERWYDAHSSHAYQHAARRFGHSRVTLAVMTINVIWLAPLALLVGGYAESAIYFNVTVLFPLVLMALRLVSVRVEKA